MSDAPARAEANEAPSADVVGDNVASTTAPPSAPAPAPTRPAAPEATEEAVAWTINMSSSRKPSGKRKVSRKEQEALGGGNRVVELDADGRPTAAAATPTTTVVNADDFIDEAIAIPRNLTTTQADMALRTHLDVLRFQCVSRPQYKRTCGVSSLTSVWNYLYSRLGPKGTLPPVSQEEVMTILGFKPPFDTIRWGSFTGNTTLMRWFHALNAHFGVTGKAYYAWKCHGLGRTFGLTDAAAETMVCEGLRNPNMAFIYHCHNHYMVPIGYQQQPHAQIHAYKPVLERGEYETTLFIGEVSRGKHQCMHIKKFSDVALDLNCASPQWYNIRNTEAGVQTRKSTRRVGGNLHCFLAFRSDIAEQDMSQFDVPEEEDDDVDDETTAAVGASIDGAASQPPPGTDDSAADDA